MQLRGDMQESFGGVTAIIKAGTAEFIVLDQGNFKIAPLQIRYG
jgi:hypothetical protein